MERVDPTLTAVPAAAGAAGQSVDEVDLIPVRTYWQLVRQRFVQHKLAVIALFVLAILITIAIIVPTLTGNLYARANLSRVSANATIEAPLGYDEIGQNIAVRLAKATQTSLIIGFASVLIIAGLGSLVGAISGYLGGWVDNVLMRFVDVVLSLPVFFIILM